MKQQMEGEVQRVEYRGDSTRFVVGVPLAQSVLSGIAVMVAGTLIIALAMWPDALGVWWIPVAAGVAWFCYLLGWRTFRDLRHPYEVEHATGEDTNRDGWVGDPRIRTTDGRMDRLARQVIRLAHSGQSISRAALVPKLLTAGEWELLRKRLMGRGVVDLDKKGAMMMRAQAYAESWARYTGGPRSSSYLVNEDGDLVEAE